MYVEKTPEWFVIRLPEGAIHTFYELVQTKLNCYEPIIYSNTKYNILPGSCLTGNDPNVTQCELLHPVFATLKKNSGCRVNGRAVSVETVIAVNVETDIACMF